MVVTPQIGLPEWVTTGPNRQGLKLRVTPRDGPTTAMVSGARAMSRLLMAREAAGISYDHLIRDAVFRLDEAALSPWPVSGESFAQLTRMAGLELEVDQEEAAKLDEHLKRVRASYSRWLPPDPEGGRPDWTFKPGTVDPEDIARADRIFRHLGWDRELFRFAYDTALEMATKRDVLIAAGMGLGKTRLALALADHHKQRHGLTGPTIIVGLKRHLIPTWPDEMAKVELVRVMHGESPYETLMEARDRPACNRPYLLLSFERLTRLDDDAMAELIEVARRSVIIVDEAYVLANRNAQRTKRLFQIAGHNHIGLSGTPSTGYISSTLPLMQWIFRGGSCALPDYPSHREGAGKRFAAKFTTFAVDDNGNRKRVPFLKNAEEFYAMIEPLFARRLRGEPEVVAALGNLVLKEETVPITLDPEHVRFYLACLKQFTAWYVRELAKRGTPNAFPANELLVKLGYLVRGVSTPWRMKDPEVAPDGDRLLDDFQWPAYPRQPTAVHRAALDRAREEVEEGRQVIIFGSSRDALDLLHEQMIQSGVPTGLIHGGVPMAARIETIRAFSRGDLRALVGSYGTLAEGTDGLQVASRALLTEYDWLPSKIRQAIGRITRIGQQEEPWAIHFTVPGSIQDYMLAWSQLKQASMDAALDNVQQFQEGTVPDIQQYAHSLIGYAEDPDQLQPRLFTLDLSEG